MSNQIEARSIGALKVAIDCFETLRYPTVSLVKGPSGDAICFLGEPESVSVPRDMLMRFARTYEAFLIGGSRYEPWNDALIEWARIYGPMSRNLLTRKKASGICLLEPLAALREHSTAAYYFRTLLELLDLPAEKLFQTSNQFRGRRWSPYCKWSSAEGRLLVGRRFSSKHPAKGRVGEHLYDVGTGRVQDCPQKIREALNEAAQRLLRHHFDLEVMLDVGADWAPRPKGRSVLGQAWLSIAAKPLGSAVDLKFCCHCGESFLVGGKFRKRSALSCSDSCKNMASRERTANRERSE